MSSLIVPITTVEAVLTHPNADSLDICKVNGGWQCVVRKDQHFVGQKVVFFPPDVVIPPELAGKLGVENYLDNGRVRTVKLRGEISFGLIAIPDFECNVGDDVANIYGVTKYLPPVRIGNGGDAEHEDPRFPKYHEIENLRNFTTFFEKGEWVEFTEKLHGSNVRIGSIEGKIIAGSRTVQRRKPIDLASNPFWLGYTIKGVQDLIAFLAQSHQQVIIYGEVFGQGIQSMTYNEPKPTFRAFDIMIDGKWMARSVFWQLTEEYQVPVVPCIYIGEYDQELLEKYASGKSTLTEKHIREGIVIGRFTTENTSSLMKLKYINNDYLLGKEKKKISDSTEE